MEHIKEDYLQLLLGNQLQVILFLIWKDQNFKRKPQKICKFISDLKSRPKYFTISSISNKSREHWIQIEFLLDCIN